MSINVTNAIYLSSILEHSTALYSLLYKSPISPYYRFEGILSGNARMALITHYPCGTISAKSFGKCSSNDPRLSFPRPKLCQQPPASHSCSPTARTQLGRRPSQRHSLSAYSRSHSRLPTFVPTLRQRINLLTQMLCRLESTTHPADSCSDSGIDRTCRQNVPECTNTADQFDKALHPACSL